jgi:hypothetical protein
MKRHKLVLNERETLNTHHGTLSKLPTPPFSPLHFCGHGSHSALLPQIFSPDTAVRFPFPSSFPTALTCPLALQTYPNHLAIFPSPAIFPSCLLSHVFTTMTVSSTPTLLRLLQDKHLTTHVPFLTNDTHDQPPRQDTLFPSLKLQSPKTTTLPPTAPLISNPYTPTTTRPRTTTAIGHVPKWSCVPDKTRPRTTTAIGHVPKWSCVPDKNNAAK